MFQNENFVNVINKCRTRSSSAISELIFGEYFLVGGKAYKL